MNNSTQAVASVSYYFGNQLIGTAVQAPYTVTFTPPARGVFTVRAVATHPDGTTEQQYTRR